MRAGRPPWKRQPERGTVERGAAGKRGCVSSGWRAWVYFYLIDSSSASFYGGPVVAGRAARSPGLSTPSQWAVSIRGRDGAFWGGHKAMDVREGGGAGGPGTPHLQGGTEPEPCRGLCTPRRDGPGSRTTGAMARGWPASPRRAGEPREVGRGTGLFGWQGLKWGPRRALSIFTW